MLEIRNINKSFGKKEILKDVSLKCNIGDIIGIFGRNGSGKSSLLKIIHGTLKADSIELEINSKLINPKKIIPSKSIAYLPQDSFLPKNLKVRNVIPLFFSNGDDQDKIFYSKGISHFENKKISTLSIGQLRYLEILLIGNLEHTYIMFDEPFSMVEPLYKEIIKEFIIDLKNEKGLIITDHYYNDVLEITDRNYIIKNGQKFKIKSKEDLEKFEYLRKN